MHLDEMTPVMPERDWDELITASMRRGRTLRRRRRALATSPLAGLLAVIVAVPLSGAFEPSHNGIARLHTTNVAPTQPVERSQQPHPSASASTRTTGGAQSTTSAPSTSRPLPGRRAPGIAPPPAVLHSVPDRGGDLIRVGQVVSFADAAGDANPGTAYSGTAATVGNDPSLDITKVRLETTSRGLRATMWLAAAYRGDGVYWVDLTDTVSGCSLDVEVGGPYRDYAYVTCGSGPSTTSTLISGVPDTVDPSYEELTAVIPYDVLPQTVSAHHRFSPLTGLTQLVDPTTHASANVDTATSSRSIGPFTS